MGTKFMIKLTMRLFIGNLNLIQYSACLAIIGTIRSTSYNSFNQELNLETLQSRRWFGKSCLFYW